MITLRNIALISTLIALLVIPLGAFTRLTDAGLGCPDWPGCYGHLIAPHVVQVGDISILKPALVTANHDSTPIKAWTEMMHRYAAGILVLLTLMTAILAGLKSFERGVGYLVLAVSLVALVVLQALLGMLTVTLKLSPIIVSLHLISGMTLSGLLWWVYLNAARHCEAKPKQSIFYDKNYLSCIIGLLILTYVQIFLGAWTSSHYASISCPSFPFCTVHHWFPLEFKPMIQMLHRVSAFLLLTYSASLLYFYRKNRTLKIFFSLLVLQILLGIGNVFGHLLLINAVLHNFVAAILLLTVISLLNVKN